jgi:molybdate transport system substrate-binding protein
MKKYLYGLVFACMAIGFSPVYGAASADRSLVVFAASSLTNVLEEAGAAFTQSSGVPVKFSFAASSALARQVEAGAKADVFFSADLEWMDYLQQRGLIQTQTRSDIVGNRLVLVAPKGSPLKLKIAPGFRLIDALGKSGKLATGEVTSVPAGKYAKTALTKLGVWSSVERRVVGAENVRAALAFVDRGEAPLGIVYESDALIDAQVRVVDYFPPDSHPPITYPVAAVNGAKPEAQSFVQFLRGDAAKALFKKYGFSPL